MHQADAMFSER